MEGVMETEAVEALAEAMSEEFYPDELPFIDDSVEFWRPFAAKVLPTLRADPAAARAVRDAIDPDGLRAALLSALDWLDHDDPYAAAHAIRLLIEGTPDAD